MYVGVCDDVIYCLLTPVDFINSSQCRSLMAEFCSSVMARSDVTKFLSRRSMYTNGSHVRTILPSIRMSLLNFLHCCSISSTSSRFHAVFFQLPTHDSTTITKSHNCCFNQWVVNLWTRNKNIQIQKLITCRGLPWPIWYHFDICSVPVRTAMSNQILTPNRLERVVAAPNSAVPYCIYPANRMRVYMESWKTGHNK